MKTNTKIQKEIEKAVAEFREKFSEWNKSSKTNVWWKVPLPSEPEIASPVEVETFLTQKLEHLARQKDEEFMGMLEDEEVIELEVNYPRSNNRIHERNNLRAELRNKLQGGRA